jgi:hypothetical protein
MPRTPRAPKKGSGKGTGVSTRPAWPDRFLTELPKHGTISGTAKAVNVGRRTVYDELERNPDFAADVREIQGACVEQVESTLFQMALDPDHTTDRIFYLKTAKPEKYGDKLRQDQIDAIRANARQAAIGELQEEIALLPDGPRRVVLAALAAMAARKQLTP